MKPLVTRTVAKDCLRLRLCKILLNEEKAVGKVPQGPMSRIRIDKSSFIVVQKSSEGFEKSGRVGRRSPREFSLH